MPKTSVIAISDHPGSSDRISFDIDFDTGEISGLEAQGVSQGYALRQLRGLAGRKEVHFAWQQSYPTEDPMHSAEALAWHLMADGWILEGELAKVAPPMPDDLPEGALA